LAAFQNPEFYKAQAMRLATYSKPRVIACGQKFPQHIGVPRHRLHDNKRFVQVYDYLDSYVPMLARMYERRLKGYSAIGYVIETGRHAMSTRFRVEPPTGVDEGTRRYCK
jgi:hypothetical protein